MRLTGVMGLICLALAPVLFETLFFGVSLASRKATIDPHIELSMDL